MEMDTIPELPSPIKRFACRAFVASCARLGVNIPLNEVTAQTVVDVDGRNLQLYWWTKSPGKHFAEGRFYPSNGGGQVLLCFVRNSVGRDVSLPQPYRDTYAGSTHGVPVMATPAIDQTLLTFLMGVQDSYGH